MLQCLPWGLGSTDCHKLHMVQEHKSGLPVEVHVPMGDGTQIPQPRAPVATAPQDIMFHLVEGDFQVTLLPMNPTDDADLDPCNARNRPAVQPVESAALPSKTHFSGVQTLRCCLQVFQGVWRMQPEAAGGTGTWLSYALHVKPPPWMPVRLIQGRIESEIAGNLQAVKAHSEQQWAAQRAMSGV